MTGHVTLVGAGPGPGLITRLGVKAIQQADVVVYDDLIDKDLLQLTQPACKQIYVGKRFKKHSSTQEEINAILVTEAKEGNEVVRLKGGDSFVFGRGGEEYLALEKEGITCSVIPGISSAIAVPASLGIPVTHREVAQSFTVITGHTAGTRTEDYAALAKLKGTLLFLMGIHSLETITRSLIENGKDKDTPAAVVCRGFSKDAVRINGTLQTIAEEAIKQKAPTPGILVVGDVAGFSMTDKRKKPLSGRQIVVTGTSSFVDRLQNKLQEKGAGVQKQVLLELIEYPERIPEDLRPYNWIVFTSSNGIALFFSELKKRRFDLRGLGHCKFACIGSGTRERLEAQQFGADFVPTRYTADTFGKELAQVAGTDARLLILRAEKGSDKLTEALDQAGCIYEDRKIYDTQWKEPADTDLSDADYLVFASAQGVQSFFHRQTLPASARIICIGEQTARELQEHTQQTFHTAREHSADGIVAQIMEWEA